MKIFLAGGEGRHWIHDFRTTSEIFDKPILDMHPFVLESFYSADKETERLIPRYGDFLLDSGAFTFMQNPKSHVDWDEYISRYSTFVKSNGITKYFELDIDSVVGYKEVLRFREKLEALAGARCIPVWHKSRGYDDFLRTCEEYPYIAIGGIVNKEITKKQYTAFPRMIKDAHQRGCKIHGLGFTALGWLPRCHFDSVDSTSWTVGNRYGFIWKFDGQTMRKINRPEGTRLGDPDRVALANYLEWLKFQKWAERNL